MIGLDSYLVLDFETNDLPQAFSKSSWNDVHIIQTGWCIVKDKKNVESGSDIMTIPNGVSMNPDSQEVHGISPEKCQDKGIAPIKALKKIYDMVMDLGIPIVGHNFVNFDSNALNINLLRYEIPSIDWKGRIQEPFYVVDTGAVQKAKKMNVVAQPGEDIWEFCLRVMEPRNRIKWKIDICLDEMKLGKERGKHDADEDCVLTHMICEWLRDDGTLESVIGAVLKPNELSF